MNFWWLFALFLFVPFIVHLFSFRKAKRIFFSTTRFLKDFAKKDESKSRLKRILILINRTFLFAAFLLILAALFADTQVPKTSDRDTVIYFDKSVSSNSMGLESFANSFVAAISENASGVLVVDDYSSERIDKGQWTGKDLSWGPYFKNENVEILTRKFAGLENFLFSDFGRWEMMDFKKIGSDTSRNYSLIHTAAALDGVNVYVDTLFLTPNAEDRNRRQLTVRLRSSNPSKETSIVIRLLKGNRQLSSLVVDLSEQVEVGFDLETSQSGVLTLELDGDQFATDNRFLFKLGDENLPVVSVLDNTSESFLTKVFQNENLFVLQELDPANIDFEELDRSDILVLASVNEIPQGVLEQFPDLTFMIFPEDDFSALQLPMGVSKATERYEAVEIDFDLSSPLLKGITEADLRESRMPEAVPFGRLNGVYEEVVQFRGDQVFLARAKNLLFFNALLDSDESNFYSHSLFLPLIYQLAFEAKKLNEIPYFFPGDYISVSEKARKNPFAIIGTEYESIPSFNSVGDGTLLEIPQDIPPGIFHLLIGKDTLKTFCVNIPKEESLKSAWQLSELINFFKGVEHVRVMDLSEISSSNLVLKESDSVPFWKYALLLALLFIVVETMLHRYLK